MVSKILFENRQTNEGFEWIGIKKSFFLHQSMENLYRIKSDDLISIDKAAQPNYKLLLWLKTPIVFVIDQK